MNRTLLLSLMFILILLGIATLNGTIVALALPLLAALVAGWIDQPGTLEMRAERRCAPDRAAQDAPVEIRLRLTNHGPARHAVEIVDQIPAHLELIDGRPRMLVSMAAGETVELAYRVRGRRGLYAFEQVQVAVADRLGLFRQVHAIPAPGRLFVLPDLLKLRQALVRPRRTRVYSGMIPARQGGPGVEFFGVRGYQPGDELRHLNIRASARHMQALYVNEYEQERVADIGIILDARERTNLYARDGALFDYSVQAATALADGFLAQGNRVGMLIYGHSIDWIFPGYGKIQREKVLRALAAARPGDRVALETFDAIPTRLFPARSLIILISPLIADDLPALAGLRARGYQLIVISPDPVAFEAALFDRMPEGAFGRRAAQIERELIMRRILQAGIPTYNWPVDLPFQQIAAQAFARRGI